MASKQQGQSLLEVLVAFAVVLIVLSAVTAVILSSLTQADHSKNINLATQYAQEGMELARGRGNFQPNDQFCLGSDGEFVAGMCPTANLGIFKREVTVETSGCGLVLRKVTVSVSWSDGRCNNSPFCHKVPIVSCI